MPPGRCVKDYANLRARNQPTRSNGPLGDLERYKLTTLSIDCQSGGDFGQPRRNIFMNSPPSLADILSGYFNPQRKKNLVFSRTAAEIRHQTVGEIKDTAQTKT